MSTKSQEYLCQYFFRGKSERKRLDELLSKLREGDTIVVWKIDRIARSLFHLVKLVEDFKKRRIHFRAFKRI
ncbi:MAG: recombinase family protein [Flavobacteriaceae bacterium]